MKKRVLSIVLVLTMVASMFAGCGAEKTLECTDGGTVFNIYAWNEEFKGFFEAYYQVPAGVTVNWIINPSDGGVYQEKLDAALKAQGKASANDRVDMFLAEADYIGKYVESNTTADIKALGYSDFSKQYQYTIGACTDANGVVKGVSFQCCPSALIYRRSIAKDVLGTDDPAEVQALVGSWDKFNAVAAQAKAKGYYMTPSFAEVFRVYSNNCTQAWVDEKNNLTMPKEIKQWIDDTKNFCDNGYTIASAGVWDAEKNDQFFEEGKTMCVFGPAWYFNFSMGNAQDPDHGTFGDWAICQGPQAHFWGGTWLLAAAGTDNSSMVVDIMNAFTNNTEIVDQLVSVNSQFVNNTDIIAKYAADDSYGNAFLGGQNDIALFAGMTNNIVWQYHTNYDQMLNEGLQTYIKDYFTGVTDYDTAMGNFYNYVNETYPNIKIAK